MGGLLTLTIGGYSADGFGVARAQDGMVVFIPGAMEGEECRVRLEKVGKSAAFGVLEEVLSPSPARLEPDCPHYGRCGGCTFRHMTYAEELRAKARRVEDALRRIGGASLPPEGVYGAPEIESYRNKAQFPVAPGKDGPRIGFYRARSHEVIPVERCLLQPPAADAAAGAVGRWMARYGVSAYDERTGAGLIRHVYVRTNRAGEALVCVLAAGESLPHRAALRDILRAACPTAVGLVLGVNRAKGNVILGDRYKTVWGQDFLMDRLCGLEFKLSVPTFYQINPGQAEVLYGLAREYAGLTGGETLVDLYCGAGTIGLSMAGQAGRLIGVESVSAAVEDARENAERNGIANAEFFLGDAGQASQELLRRGLRPDVVVVDPQRKGLERTVVEAVAELAPARLVYVSCDPATLARDIKLFAEKGYLARRMSVVDLFPRTAHVETVVLLSRD